MKPIDISQLPENDPRSWMTEEQYATRLNALQQKSHSELSEEDVRVLIREFTHHAIRQRYIVLHLHRTKGWKQLGYARFVDFGKDELVISHSHLYRLRHWAEIEIILFGEGQNLLGEYSPSGGISLPDRHARVLSKLQLPEKKKTKGEEYEKKLDADAIRRAYAQAKEIAKTKVYPTFDGKPHPAQGKVTVKILEEIVNKMKGKSLADVCSEVHSEPETFSPVPADFYVRGMNRAGKQLIVDVTINGIKQTLPFSIPQIRQALGEKV